LFEAGRFHEAVAAGLDTEAYASRHGLAALEQEIWRGFIFVRMAPGLPSVAEMMSPYESEIEPHGFENLMPQGRVTLRPRAVNWKNVSDNYGDGLHIPVAHPGLTRLFGNTYALEAKPWVDKMDARVGEKPAGIELLERYAAAAISEQVHGGSPGTIGLQRRVALQ
jgi:phenylpropionate dioxygenase-like ring-hydroxylating dioxygenase large terminal subunit